MRMVVDICQQSKEFVNRVEIKVKNGVLIKKNKVGKTIDQSPDPGYYFLCYETWEAEETSPQIIGDEIIIFLKKLTLLWYM